MSSRFSRFLHLERARDGKAAEGEPVSLRDGSRFESVAERGPASEPRGVPEAHLERFKPPEPPALKLELEEGSGRHFSRCIRCETENGRFARVCGTCGADLSTPEQRAEDERRGQQRLREEARAREEMRVRQAEPPPPVRGESAPEVPSLFEPSLGVGLVRRLSHPVARGLGVAGAVALPWLLTRGGRGPAWALGMYLGVFVAASLVPSAFWMKRKGDG